MPPLFPVALPVALPFALLVALLASGLASVSASAADRDFASWLAEYRAGAISRGLKPEWLDATLAGMEPNLRVIELDRNQPDDSRATNLFSDYLARRLTPDRIAAGRTRYAELRPHLPRLAADAGVPAEILLSIWGMETSYGAVTGNLDVPRALASLAWDGRREALFTRELDAAVRMVGTGQVSRERFRGSWAGATGQPQFLPSSYLAHAADGDGDGRADIWGSSLDALASIGRYLSNNGWVAGVPWGIAVTVPAGFDRQAVANPEKPKSCVRPMEKHSRFLSVAQWKERGILAAQWPPDDVEMSLVEPDGPGNGAWLASANFRALMAYNCSNFYALSVGMLGDALRP
jgi:lytic murein transglycosylase